MIKRHPRLFVVNAILGIILTAIDGLMIVSIAPIISLLMGENENSPITKYFNSFAEYTGIDASIEKLLILIIILNIFKAIIQTGIEYFIYLSQYQVIKGMIVEVTTALLSSSVNFLKKEKLTESQFQKTENHLQNGQKKED